LRSHSCTSFISSHSTSFGPFTRGPPQNHVTDAPSVSSTSEGRDAVFHETGMRNTFIVTCNEPTLKLLVERVDNFTKAEVGRELDMFEVSPQASNCIASPLTGPGRENRPNRGDFVDICRATCNKDNQRVSHERGAQSAIAHRPRALRGNMGVRLIQTPSSNPRQGSESY